VKFPFLLLFFPLPHTRVTREREEKTVELFILCEKKREEKSKFYLSLRHFHKTCSPHGSALPLKYGEFVTFFASCKTP